MSSKRQALLDRIAAIGDPEETVLAVPPRFHKFDSQGHHNMYRCRYCGTAKYTSHMPGWPPTSDYFSRAGEKIEGLSPWSLDAEQQIPCELDPALRRNADAEVALDALEAIATGTPQ